MCNREREREKEKMKKIVYSCVFVCARENFTEKERAFLVQNKTKEKD